jgi:hypothetical protein
VPACIGELQQLQQLQLAGSFGSLPAAMGSCRRLRQLSVASTPPGVFVWLSFFSYKSMLPA